MEGPSVYVLKEPDCTCSKDVRIFQYYSGSRVVFVRWSVKVISITLTTQ